MNTKQLTAFAEGMMHETSTQTGEWVTVSRIALDEMSRESLDAIAALEEAERERDELRVLTEQDGRVITNLNEAVNGLYDRIHKAEADIARRDAAVGEPVMYQIAAKLPGFWKECGKETYDEYHRHLGKGEHFAPVRALYTDAPSAVLPPAMTYAEALKVCDWKNDQASIWVEGANWMREQCLALGAQPQKVVELYKRKSMEVISGQRYSYVLLEDLLPELEAANVKYEVKK